jgi:ribosomal protein L16/L10AE
LNADSHLSKTQTQGLASSPLSFLSFPSFSLNSFSAVTSEKRLFAASKSSSRVAMKKTVGRTVGQTVWVHIHPDRMLRQTPQSNTKKT